MCQVLQSDTFELFEILLLPKSQSGKFLSLPGWCTVSKWKGRGNFGGGALSTPCSTTRLNITH